MQFAGNARPLDEILLRTKLFLFKNLPSHPFEALKFEILNSFVMSRAFVLLHLPDKHAPLTLDSSINSIISRSIFDNLKVLYD